MTRIKATELSPPDGVDPLSWREACQCARLQIMANSTTHRHYGHPDLDAALFESSCEQVSQSAVYPLAFKAVQSDVQSWQRDEDERKRLDQHWADLRRHRLPPEHERAWERKRSGLILGHQRHQLPVGQGGFHVGTLTDLRHDPESWREAIEEDAIANADFIYAYDCGSVPVQGVIDEIQLVVDQRVNRRLDILFVSHFDRDHITGIPYLLHDETGLKVDTVVMPYLDDLDRMIAFARTAAAAADAKTDSFHAELVVDPVAAMRRFDPRIIIMVAPTDEDGGATVTGLPAEDPPASPPGAAPWQVTDDGRRRRSDPFVGRTPDGAYVMGGGSFEVMSRSGQGWRLKPHVRTADRELRDAFAAAVEVLLSWRRGSFARLIAEKATRESMVKEHRETVGRAYKWAFGDKNLTSLSLYSGPLAPELVGAVHPGVPEHEKARVGWMGTGDAGLKDRRDIQIFRHHYNDELQWVTTFVLPHHGSLENYDPASPVTHADLWVAAAQPVHSNWQHPHPDIVAAIAEAKSSFRKVGARPDVPLVERIVIFPDS